MVELSYGGWNSGECKLKNHYRFSLTGIATGVGDETDCKNQGYNWIGGKCYKSNSKACEGNAMCSYNKIDSNCYSCSHSRFYKKERKSCIGPNHASSKCGWGNVRNVCERINEIGKCTSLYNDWQPDLHYNQGERVCYSDKIWEVLPGEGSDISGDIPAESIHWKMLYDCECGGVTSTPTQTPTQTPTPSITPTGYGDEGPPDDTTGDDPPEE